MVTLPGLRGNLAPRRTGLAAAAPGWFCGLAEEALLGRLNLMSNVNGLQDGCPGKSVTFPAGLLFTNGKHMSMDDWELLKNYSTRRSEEAFRALVERHAGMVYHAALRQTGNPHAAEEIAQVVFIDLARKAANIPRQATLHGWLFRATRFAVLNQARQNANWKRHEQEAVAMQPIIEPNETDSVWERITPELNDALDKLSATDREVVMIRFFGNKSHKDVAATLGVSEETARKRISRAMEKLRVIFARRGIAVSSLVLTAAFAAHGAKAAPIEVASSWAKVAMAKAAAGTATASAGGILALVNSATSPSLIAALAGLVVLAGIGLTITKSLSRRPPAAAASATNVAMDAGTLKQNGSSVRPATPSRLARETEPDAALAAALDKVKVALHDPNPTTLYPNPVMQEAIAGLGGHKQAALPILEASLNDDVDPPVRLRAIDGLGIIGPEAKEAAPLLLGVLRGGGFSGKALPQIKIADTGALGTVTYLALYPDNITLYALGLMRPSSEILSEFASLVKTVSGVRGIVLHANSQFADNRRTLQSGGWLWGIANENPEALNNAFHPLLQDPDPTVRAISALALVAALGTKQTRRCFRWRRNC